MPQSMQRSAQRAAVRELIRAKSDREFARLLRQILPPAESPPPSSIKCFCFHRHRSGQRREEIVMWKFGRCKNVVKTWMQTGYSRNGVCRVNAAFAAIGTPDRRVSSRDVACTPPGQRLASCLVLANSG